MEENQGVNESASPADDKGVSSEGVQVASPTTESGVTAESPTAGRTLENLAAEMHRRDEARQKQLDSVLAWIGSQGAQQRPQPQAAPQSQEPSDDDLWALAQQGDRQAFETYQRRIARREVQQASGAQNRTNLVSAQLNALVNRYTVLRDPSHPLTQTVQQAYALLVNAGYAQGPETLLEATKTAIADRPDLITEIYSQAPQAREQTRQSASTRAQSGVTGSTVRQGSAPAPQARITSEEARLAERMGVKDPKASKARFLKRQESGQSNLGAVGGFPSVIQEMEGFDK